MGQALGFLGLGGFGIGSLGSRCCILGFGIGGLGTGFGLLLGHSGSLGFAVGFSSAGFGSLLGGGGFFGSGDCLLLVALGLLGLFGGGFGLLGGAIYLLVGLCYSHIRLGNTLIGFLNRGLGCFPGKPARACGHHNPCCCG